MEEKNRVKDLDPEKYREKTTDFIQVAGLHFNFTKKIRENTMDSKYIAVLHFDFTKKLQNDWIQKNSWKYNESHLSTYVPVLHFDFTKKLDREIIRENTTNNPK